MGARFTSIRIATGCLPLLAILLTGCATSARPDSLYSHVIQFDTDGNTVDPRTGNPFSISATQKQFTDILDSASSYLADKPQRKIILYVHGGLTSPAEAIDSAAKHVDDITNADPNCYPIFVIWDSSLGSAYQEHLYEVRQGRKDSSTKQRAKFDFPIYFLSDILVAIGRAPTVWLQQRSTDDEAIGGALASIGSYYTTASNEEHAESWMEKKRNLNAMSFFIELNQRYLEDQNRPAGSAPAQMAISIGKDYSEPADWLGRGTLYVLFLPTKMLTAPLIDALGTAGWRDMSRRAQTIVEGSSDFEITKTTTTADIERYLDRGTEGGLDHFIKELALRSHVPVKGKDPDWQVTLIGHSMGTMVLNEALRRQQARESTAKDRAKIDLPVKNIVYMAAACSIRQFTTSVIPFMQQKNHADVNFYSLCLHPTAEILEAEFHDIPPRGSLLCWIDDFLETPDTPLDRTLGRWTNLLGVAYCIPQPIRGRVAIKAFPLEREDKVDCEGINHEPQQHGDFSDSPFWNPQFWQPDQPLKPDNERRKVIELHQEKIEKHAPNAPKAKS